MRLVTFDRRQAWKDLYVSFIQGGVWKFALNVSYHLHNRTGLKPLMLSGKMGGFDVGEIHVRYALLSFCRRGGLQVALCEIVVPG